MKKKELCSFCGRDETEVERLIIGTNATICNVCINNFYNMLKRHREDDEKKYVKKLPAPKEIKGFLDKFVISQEEAKKVLSVAVYNHYKRILLNLQSEDDIEIQKSNILLIGPTGSGKTLLAETLAKILDVPFAIADATTLTEAGYVGEDVENILLRLIENADFDIKRAERGIIYIDEIDKISKKGENVSITRDVSGEGVQQALLKIIEGTIANVPPKGGRKHPYQDYIKINTKDILFIVGGAFVGLEKIVQKRIEKKVYGYKGNQDTKKIESDSKYNILKNTLPIDLIKFGLIPEFIGRIPVITVLHELTENDLINILDKPKNSILKQYEKILKLEGIKFEFLESAKKTVAEEAIKKQVGARGLRSIIEKIMIDIMYEIPTDKNIKKIIIDKDIITGQKSPLKAIIKNKIA